MKLISKYYYIISCIIFIVFCSIAINNLFSSGTVIFGDIDFGFDSSKYIDHLFPVRNELWSTSNFFNMPRLAFVFPFFKIFYSIGGSGLFERSIFIFTILLSGISTISLSNCIINKFIKKEEENFKLYISLIVGLILGGLLYAINPYALIRIHHFYLYVGYALFPLFIKYLIVLYDTIDAEASNSKLIILDKLKNICILSIIFVILSASMHYIIFTLIVIFLFGIYNFIHYTKNKQYNNILSMTISMSLLVIIFIGILSYFALPYIEASSIPDFGPKNINTIDTINLFSRFSSIENVILLKSYRRPMYDYSDLGGILEIGGYIIILNIILGIYINRKYKSIKYLSLLILILIVAGTGTHYLAIAPIYSYFVLNNPISSTIGLIFRDPNKIVGIICIIYSVIFSLSTFQISQAINNINSIGNNYTNQIEKIKKIFYRLFISLNIIGIYLFVFPATFDYMKYFYNPIATPAEYKDIKQYNLSEDNSKSIFLPRYEKEKLPGYDFAVTSRNNNTGDKKIQKPTGSADIYSIPLATYHPLEGNDESVNYFYSFLDSYFTNGYGLNIAEILESTNIKYLFYHKDILGREEIDENQIKNINIQKGLKLINEKGFMKIRGLDNKGSDNQKSNNYIYSFGGVRDWLSCVYITGNQICKNYIFNKQKIDSEISTGSLVIVNDKNDYDFNLTKNKIVISPFDFINGSNPRIGRAKTKTASADRLYYINYLNIINYIWDFDYNKGAVFSFSPSSFSIPSYENINNYGKVLFNLKDIDNISQLLVGGDDANESNIKFAIDKKSSNDRFVSIKSSLIMGNSQIRRLGSTKFFPVKGNNGYGFKIKVSGLQVNKLHMKIRFFDEKFNELSIGYISTPESASTYDNIELKDSFISPNGTEYLQIQFYSLENPFKESFWRLHDLEIRDLAEITIENKINISSIINTGGIYDLYIRSFYSSKGGMIKFDFNQLSGYINTKRNGNGKFERNNLGKIQINSGESLSGYIKNIEGFNSVNIIRLKPEKSTVEHNVKQVILQEAELYGQHSGNLQSYVHYPILSNGKSVNILSGYIKFEFDILKDGYYNIKINKNQLFKGNANINIYISGNNNIKNIFNDHIKNISNINKTFIEKGKYNLYIYIKDNNPSYINTSDLHINNTIISGGKTKKEDSFDTENRKNNYMADSGDILGITGDNGNLILSSYTGYIEESILEDEKGCSYYYDRNTGNYTINNTQIGLNISLEKGYGCKWLIITNDKIKVTPENEYLIMFDIDKKNSKKLHSKVQFFDSGHNLIQTKGLDVGDDINGKNLKINNQLFDLEVGSYGKSFKGHYEDIVTSPKNAEYMTVEIWQKQRQDIKSEFKITNLIVREYKSIAGIDSILLEYESQEKNKTNKKSIIKQYTPYSPLRTLSGSKSRPFQINLFINGFWSDSTDNKNTEFEYIPNRKFQIGKYITYFFLFLISAVFISYKIIQKNKKL